MLTVEGEEDDFTAGVEAQWQHGDADAAASESGEVAVTPKPAGKIATAREVSDYWPPARKGDLATVGVTAQVELVAIGGGGIGQFRRMNERNLKAVGGIGEGVDGVLGEVRVNIIDAGQV